MTISVLCMQCALADTYEVVRGKELPLCRELAKNFNEFRNDPPMTCERKFSPKFKDFSRPDWQLLPTEQAAQVAIAIERSRVNKYDEPDRIPFVEKETKGIKEAAASGKLKVWEATFDLAGSGSSQKVSMLSRGSCETWTEKEYDVNEPRIAVLLPGKFDVDKRFRQFLIQGSDAFLYQGQTFLASWSAYPSGTARSLEGLAPPKRHRAYVLVWRTFWRPPGTEGADFSGSGGYYGPICQIGYQRIK
jgi:hypothetical protein